MKRTSKKDVGRRVAEDREVVQLWVRDQDLDDIQALVRSLLVNDAASHRLRREIATVLAGKDSSGFGARLWSFPATAVRH
jgi:hypothetical protein